VWYELTDKKSVKNLLNQYDGFHDSCLKEMMIHTNSFVDEEYRMSVEPTFTAYLYFQSQCELPASTIEMKFEEVIECHLMPHTRYYDAIIFDVKIAFFDDAIYWANSADFSPEQPHYQKGLYWLSAKKVYWRPIEAVLGSENRYIVSE